MLRVTLNHLSCSIRSGARSLTPWLSALVFSCGPAATTEPETDTGFESEPAASTEPEVAELDLPGEHLAGPSTLAAATYFDSRCDSTRVELVDLERAVRLDLEGLSDDQRRTARYLSFAHLYNSGDCSDALQVARAALVVGLSSVSLSLRGAWLVDVGDGGWLYRIDLEALEWDHSVTIGGVEHLDVWQALIAADEFALVGDSTETEQLESLAGTASPILRGDALLTLVGQGELYSRLLGIPDTRDGLLESLGMDWLEGVEGGDVTRAGYRTATGERLVQQANVEIYQGSYWELLDFAAAEEGERLLDNVEVALAGEFALPRALFFQLRNGMYAFASYDEAGDQRLFEPESAQSAGAGFSCLGCHSAGPVAPQDDVRDAAFGRGYGFATENADVVEGFRKLYRGGEMGRQAEQEAFLLSERLEEWGGASRLESPLTAVLERFAGELTVRDVAGELWVSEERLNEAAEAMPELLRELLSGARVHISRDEWRTVYAPTLCALGRLSACSSR